MKYVACILILLISYRLHAQDLEDSACKNTKFKYRDLAKIIDKSNFFYGCEGVVIKALPTKNTNGESCYYYLQQICGDQEGSFTEDKLKKTGKSP